MPGNAKVFVFRARKKKFLWNCRLLSTSSELARGIMRSQKNFVPCLFVFPRTSRWRNAIHSFFCPPFDAVFVDEKLCVTEVLSVAPNNLFVLPSAPAKYLLELRAGNARQKKLKKGEKLSFEFSRILNKAR